MLLAWDNKLDAGTVVAGAQVATLPGSNVQNVHLSKKWQTPDATNSSNLTIDLGASISCSMLAVLGTNLTAATVARLRASDLDPAALANLLLDTGNFSNVKTGYGAVYKLFAAQAARYWRIDLTDASLVNLQVGRVFLGPSWTKLDTLQYGWGIQPADESPVVESYGGQAYPDSRPKRRVLTMTLDFMSEADAFDNPFALARSNGVVKDVLGIPFEAGARISEQAVWGLCQPLQPVIHRITRTFIWKLMIRERL